MVGRGSCRSLSGCEELGHVELAVMLGQSMRRAAGLRLCSHIGMDWRNGDMYGRISAPSAAALQTRLGEGCGLAKLWESAHQRLR